MKIKIIIILTACLIAITSANAVVTVGSSPGFGICDYTSIQDAIDSGDDDIRVLNNQTFFENLQINTSTTLKGGYPTCTDAASNSHFNINEKSTIDGSSNQGESVITITSNLPDDIIALINLELINADDASGLHISGTDGSVIVADLGIFNNSAENGAGVYFNTTTNQLQLQLHRTTINANNASLSGGGLFCDRNSPNENNVFDSILFFNSVEMISNSATLSGGAIAATNGCNINIIYGSSDTEGKIKFNNAGFGGAIALTTHSKLSLTNQINPFIFEQNTSVSHGGAIYISNGHELTIQNADFINNSSTNGDGGAIYINGLDGSGIASSLTSSKLTGNSANFGAVFYVKETGDATQFTIDTSMFYKNGDGNDKYLINSKGDVAGRTEIEILNSTIVDNNTDPAFAMINTNTANLEIRNSIIYNQGTSVLNTLTSQNTMICLLLNEDASIIAQIQAQNRVVNNFSAFDFIDSANNDYRLGLSSTAIDWCDNAPSSSPEDIEGQPRGWDAPNIKNGFGSYDAGADESYIYDVIFMNGFE